MKPLQSQRQRLVHNSVSPSNTQAFLTAMVWCESISSTAIEEMCLWELMIMMHWSTANTFGKNTSIDMILSGLHWGVVAYCDKMAVDFGTGKLYSIY